MRIYDCFTFYNEFELLELRLKSLWNVADYFVIVEGNRTFTGKPKDFNFPKRAEEFKAFWSKIRFINADLSKVPFKGTGDWSIENAQRNAIMHGLNDAQPDDLIMISDLDEIPAPDTLQRLHEVTVIAPAVLPLTVATGKKTFPAQLLVPASHFLEYGAIVMEQKLFCYYLDKSSLAPWYGTILNKRKNLTMPQAMRDMRHILPRVANGGYHFSYMGGVDRVINKMTSIVDGNELVVRSGGKFIERAHVEKAMVNGTDAYDRKNIPESHYYPYDARNIRLPHLEEFLKKYPHFLHEPKKFFGENY